MLGVTVPGSSIMRKKRFKIRPYWVGVFSEPLRSLSSCPYSYMTRAQGLPAVARAPGVLVLSIVVVVLTLPPLSRSGLHASYPVCSARRAPLAVCGAARRLDVAPGGGFGVPVHCSKWYDDKIGYRRVLPVACIRAYPRHLHSGGMEGGRVRIWN